MKPNGVWAPACPSLASPSLAAHPGANIGNRVWRDLNCNGVQDPSEPGIEGVTVELRKDGALVATTTTDANGAYSFSNVAPGTYTVVFKKPAGLDFTAPGQGNDLLLDSKVTNPASGSTDPLTILPGKSISNIDAGLCTGVWIGIGGAVGGAAGPCPGFGLPRWASGLPHLLLRCPVQPQAPAPSAL